jgi:hypothetical protein
MDMNILRVPDEFDESPITVKIGGVDTVLESYKWYMLSIVKFKYLYSTTGQTSNRTKYKFIIINAYGNKKIKYYLRYQLDKFDSLMLDNRRDVKKANRIFGENAIKNAETYSEELVKKKMEDLQLKDYDKDSMLPITGESEEDLNNNTILNLG